MTKKAQIAKILLTMTFSEIEEVADDLVQMQVQAKEDEWEWEPGETYGEFGLLRMLHSWAEANTEG